MKEFKLSDLMTAKQAIEIIDTITELQKRVINLENEVQALRTELTWHEVTLNTEYYKNEI